MGAIAIAIAAPGQTVEGVLMDMAVGQYWNGAAMVAYNSANWASYNVAMPEDTGSGRYKWTMPGGVPNGSYWLTPYLLNAPPTPVLGGDTPLDIVRLGWKDGNLVEITSALNVGAINGVAAAAVNLAASAASMVIGAAAAGTLSTTQMTTNLGATVANIYAGRVLYFTSGVNAGLACLITAYAVTGGKLTFIAYGNNAAPSAPSAADTFVII